MEYERMSSSGHLFDLDPFENHIDVGAVQQPGTCIYDPEQQVFMVTGSDTPAGEDFNAFHYVFRRMSGDFILTARANWAGAEPGEQALMGWMARTSLEPDSKAVSAAIHANGQPALRFRQLTGGMVEELMPSLDRADVIQLERKGRRFILSAAQFGQPFTAIEISEIDLGASVYVGLFVHAMEHRPAQAVFTDVRIVAPVKADFNREKDPFGSRLEILDVASGRRQVIYSADEVFEAPNWTRDGQALIYNSKGRLYRFDLETRIPALIDTGAAVMNNNDHVISFDGSMLAISSHTGPAFHSMIYTVPLAGGEARQVTPTGPSYLHGWSPDGRFLVFTGLRNGDYDIYRVPAVGGDEVQLTSAPGLDDGPEYTPDGRFIYFNSVRSGRMQIWRMQPDGSEQQQLTDDDYNNWFPHISPDGQWVIFITYRSDEVDPGDHPPAKRVYLRRMPINGGAPEVVAYLYGGQGTMNVPSWSPDGTKVAFVSNTAPF
jgi:Tol biopolymer transport system component